MTPYHSNKGKIQKYVWVFSDSDQLCLLTQSAEKSSKLKVFILQGLSLQTKYKNIKNFGGTFFKACSYLSNKGVI